MEYSKDKHPNLIIDCSHLGRHTTGLERITEELFSQQALQSCKIEHVPGGNVKKMIFQQWIGLVVKGLTHAKAFVITPGFPPSILLSILCRKRVIPYIHDMFLITRNSELNVRAKYYMRPSLKFAVGHLNRFFVNSIKTKVELQQFCRKDADIIMYRPKVRNVFDVAVNQERYQNIDINKIKILMIGTVEPRKNYPAAIELFRSLKKKLGDNIELHVVGRLGWGKDAEALQQEQGVICHGYAEESTVKSLISECTFFLSTSHDEGLGLPLLEVQYSGIAVIASDIEIYREVLGHSGILIDTATPDLAAEQIIQQTAEQGWLEHAVARSFDNVNKWNEQAEKDHANVLRILKGTI
jgi:glycosyltransferase involved in cell wall biosynthesis